jgi:predicted nucleotidyltransferase
LDELPSSDDLREFLKSLTAREVSFLVLGGYAVALHGYPRATADFDPWVDSSAINADRVLAALRDFGFTPTEEAAQALRTPGKVLRMGYPPTRIELLTAPAGVEFGPCRARAVTKDLFGVAVPVIGLDDLIANKRAAGRPKDLIDAAELERIRSRLER